MNCYCGSGQSFANCCQPILKGEQYPAIPEQLMRSRYSAYATKNAQYIFATYANEKRADNSIGDIQQWADETHWLRLVVHGSDQASITNFNNKAPSTVTFSVYYLHNKLFFKMTECSRFVVEDKHWRYLDGDITEHSQLVIPKRNEKCLCLSNKKFKQCCGKLV